MNLSISARRTVVVAVGAAALLTGGVAIAAADDASPGPADSVGATRTPPGDEVKARAFKERRAFGGPVHGEYVVSDGQGGFRTELMQRGTITSVSDTLLSVKSADGYTQDYTLSGDRKFADLKQGQEITVVATKEGDTVTLRRVMTGGGPGRKFGHRMGPGGTVEKKHWAEKDRLRRFGGERGEAFPGGEDGMPHPGRSGPGHVEPGMPGEPEPMTN